jgi:hypothetical protein
MRRAVALTLILCTTMAGFAASAAAKPLAADTTLAGIGVLNLSDLPAGWQQGPAGAPTDFSKLGPVCRSIATATKARTARMGSGRFAQGQNQIVLDDVLVFGSRARATAALRAFQGSQGAACLKQNFTASLKQASATSGAKYTVSLNRIPVVSAGDASIGYEAVIRAAGSTGVSIFDDVITIAIGRVVVVFRIAKVSSPPAGTFDTAIQAVATRLKTAQGIRK